MRKFPIILQHSDGYVVNFTSRNNGVVVIGNNQYREGFHSDKWISAHDKFMWTELTPSDRKRLGIDTSFTFADHLDYNALITPSGNKHNKNDMEKIFQKARIMMSAVKWVDKK